MLRADLVGAGEDGVIGQYSGQIMGYIYEPDGRVAEAYGVRLSADYPGRLPAQMLCIDVPESEYVVFEYPSFDYETECEQANRSIEEAEKHFDMSKTYYRPEQLNNRVSYLYFMPDKYLKTLRPITRSK